MFVARPHHHQLQAPKIEGQGLPYLAGLAFIHSTDSYRVPGVRQALHQPQRIEQDRLMVPISIDADALTPEMLGKWRQDCQHTPLEGWGPFSALPHPC